MKDNVFSLRDPFYISFSLSLCLANVLTMNIDIDAIAVATYLLQVVYK